MKLLIMLLCFWAAALSAEDKKAQTPEQQTTAHIDELKQKIARDPERDIAINSAELVRELVEQFNIQMNAGELQPAQRTLDDIGTYADKARDGAKNKHHKLKQAELILHKSARRLADIAQSLALENRPAINAMVQRIEAADDAILSQVFKD